MNRKQFDNLKKDDYLLMYNGRIRRILKVTQCSNERVQLKPRTSISLKKLSGRGQTIYVYGDLKNKIIGVYRLKPTNAQELKQIK